MSQELSKFCSIFFFICELFYILCLIFVHNLSVKADYSKTCIPLSLSNALCRAVNNFWTQMSKHLNACSKLQNAYLNIHTDYVSHRTYVSHTIQCYVLWQMCHFRFTSTDISYLLTWNNIMSSVSPFLSHTRLFIFYTVLYVCVTCNFVCFFIIATTFLLRVVFNNK